MASVAVKIAGAAASVFTASAGLANGAGSSALRGAVGESHRRGSPGEGAPVPAPASAADLWAETREDPEARKLLPLESAADDDGDGGAACCCDRVVGEFRWAYRETRGMLLGGDEPLEAFSWWVRYNPCYWVLVVAIVACLLPGRWVHAPFGQGGPIREDEAPAEKLARIHWIYCTDGPMALGALLGVAELASYAAAGDFGDDQDTWAATISALICVAYVGGNVLFLESMRRRDVVRVRIGIVANATFALGMLALLLMWITVRGWDPGSWDAKKWGTITLRTVVIIFYCAVILDYAPLWSLYEMPEDRWRGAAVDVLSVCGSVVAAVAVLGLLAIAIATSGDVVWETLVG